MSTNRPTVTLDADTAESIFAEIASLQKRVEALKKRVVKLLPAKYGSDLWWAKEIEEAQKEIKGGKAKKFNTMEEALRYLDS